MSFAVAFLLAAAGVQPVPADAPSGPDRGAQLATARTSATILRPAVLRAGSLVPGGNVTPHSQRRNRDGRVTYEFE